MPIVGNPPAPPSLTYGAGDQIIHPEDPVERQRIRRVVRIGDRELLTSTGALVKRKCFGSLSLAALPSIVRTSSDDRKNPATFFVPPTPPIVS